MNKQKIHYNKAQLKAFAIGAKTTVIIAGRGTGKTEGMITPQAHRNMMMMPRSVGGFMGISYTHLLEKVLPGTIKGWEKLGFIQNVHFWFNEFPPKKYKLDKPFRAPLSPKFFFTAHNGSGAYLLPATSVSNAVNLDWLIVDEGRLIPYDHFRETALAVRGSSGEADFGHLPCFKSILITTDMPRKSEEKWIMDFEDKATPEIAEGILKIQSYLSVLRKSLEKAPKSKARKLQSSIDKFQSKLYSLQKQCTYFTTVSTLENVHVLGLETLWQFKKHLSDFDYRLSILSEKMRKIERGFYPHFSIAKHGYTAENTSYLVDSLDLSQIKSIQKDCRWDADLLLQPLDIAFDHNIDINTMVIGQYAKAQNTDKIINAICVEHPKDLFHLLDEFNRYYSPHKKKNNILHYYYDHTSKQGRNASKTTMFKEDITEYLAKLGWEVREHNMGMATLHVERYKLWAKTFQEQDTKLPLFRINSYNCEDLIISLENAGAILGKDGYKKDKKPETATDKEGKKKYNQRHTTHYTEALDVYWTAKYYKKSSYEMFAVL